MPEIHPDEINAANKARNRAEYDALPGLNQSTARLFMRSIAHGAAALNAVRKPSEAMVLGILAHKAVLEPADWKSGYKLIPSDAPTRPSDRLRNAKKPSPETLAAVQYWDDLLADFPADRLVDEETSATVNAIAASVNRAIEDYGIKIVATEVALTADYIVPIKGSLDIISEDGYIFDIKTTGAFATREDWGRGLEREPDLALQIAWYCLLYRENFGRIPNGFRHIVVETKPPYATQVFEADDEIRARGVLNLLMLIDRVVAYREAQQSADPVELPAYPREIIKVAPWKPSAASPLNFA